MDYGHLALTLLLLVLLRWIVRERDQYRRAKHDLMTSCRAYRERLAREGIDPDEVWPLL